MSETMSYMSYDDHQSLNEAESASACCADGGNTETGCSASEVSACASVAKPEIAAAPVGMQESAGTAVLPMTEAELENYRLHRRFDRMGRLVGDRRMKKLMDAHVMVIGVGGVGSWAAESLARSGVGELTVVDFDEVCVTNFNRQLHAVAGTVGSQKSDIMAARLRTVNPQAKIHSIAKFYNADHCAEIFARRPDYVIDAIDNITAKCHLLAFCKKEGIPVATSTGSGGRMDPTQVRLTDLARTQGDPLAREVRRILREKHGFPDNEGGDFGILAAYSNEPTMAPLDLHYDGGKGFRCVCPQADNPYFQCEKRNVILGNASFVTGTFGFTLASAAVRAIAGS